MKVKKIFTGLLVGTLALVGQVTVFAGTGQENSSNGKSIGGVIELTKTIEATDGQAIDLIEGEAAMLVATVEAINIEDMTPEQVAQMEKEQKELESRIEEVCKKVGYDFTAMMEHFKTGMLTDKEEEILVEAGIIMAATVVEATETVQVEEIQNELMSQEIQFTESVSTQSK
nr:hypothetical protein [uncultured Niameybacter sp.]